MLRLTVHSSVILDFVKPVFQMRGISMEVYCDLAECVDTPSTLRFLVMILAMPLLAAEVERHCATNSNGGFAIRNETKCYNYDKTGTKRVWFDAGCLGQQYSDL